MSVTLSKPRKLNPLALILLGLAFLVLLDRGIDFWVDSRWFAELGYGSVLGTRALGRWGVGILAGGIAGVVIRRNLILTQQGRWVPWAIGLTVLGSSILAWLLAQEWLTVLTWIHHVPFGEADPVFHRDLGFYVFGLPFWHLLQGWVKTLITLVLGLVMLIYGVQLGLSKHHFSQHHLSQHQSTGALPLPTQRHLLTLVGSWLLVQSWGHWLNRFDLLYSQRGVVYGVGFSDLYAALPAQTALAVFTVGAGVAFFGIALYRWDPQRYSGQRPASGLDSGPGPLSSQRRWIWSVLIPLGALGLYGLLNGLGSQALPALVHSFVVLPSELERERPFLERTIRFTQQGFGLTSVDRLPFSDVGHLTLADIEHNAATIKNIRLWDPDPLLASYRQLQEIRPYYQFPFVDVDRYQINQELRQVMHAARELDFSQVPERAKTWLNRLFFYTHGYGLTLSPVNIVTREGLPAFFIEDIPPRATNAAVQAAMPITTPAIYFGEITNTHVFVNSGVQELDYAQADQNIYGSYEGSGGIPVRHFWDRGALAWYFRDPRILLSHNLTPDSRLLMRRTIVPRARQLAPFLHFDQDPYMVISGGRLYWILDAYTVSSHFPYSEPLPFPDSDFPDSGFSAINYIRNSVKAVVDAYNGTVGFYVSDPSDPLIQTYQQVFPTLFQPLDHLSPDLKAHLRYPVDLFRLQSQQFATYHMNDPQVFYNREDQWQIPIQVREGEGQPMDPQYLILELPGQRNKAEFVLLLPFTPLNKQNLIAWMAVRCDGSDYGKIVVYEFSRQRLVFGPQQVEARINQDPLISEQLSLWNQHGSRVNHGSLLVIPVENSLLYVQPLYLEAEESRLPQLTRVLAAYEDQVVMGRTLDESLGILFGTADQPIGNPQERASSVAIPQLPAQLRREALQLWKSAEAAQRRGDQATVDRIHRQLGETLQEMNSLSISPEK